MQKKLSSKKTSLKSIRAKAFLITLNQIELFDTLLANIRGYSPDYIVAAKEVAPSTGHIHVHMYIHFADRVSLKIIDCCGAHIDRCKGSPQQNIKYVMKDGDILIEEGTRPHKGGFSIKEVFDMPREERLNLPFHYLNSVLRVNSIEDAKLEVNTWFKNIEVIYIYGRSGIGKSKRAKEIIAEHGYTHFNCVKYITPFWHGVSDNVDAALYDDFRDSHLPASEFINFIDYNKHSLNIKGATVINTYKLIVITTVQKPEDIYPNIQNEPRKQWMRRMKVIHMLDFNGNNAIDGVSAEVFVNNELE